CGVLGTALLKLRDKLETAEWTKRRRLQMNRRKGQPSPLEVACFVAAHEDHEGKPRGAAAAAARHFEVSPSTISKLLKVAEECREVLEAAKAFFQVLINGADRDKWCGFRQILAETEQALQKLPPRR